MQKSTMKGPKVIRSNSLKSIYVGQPFTHFCDRIGKNSKKELGFPFWGNKRNIFHI